MTGTTVATHPAKFSPRIVETLTALAAVWLPPGARILDPFAGVGGVHALADHGYDTVGIELEPEWAGQHPRTLVGDATRLPFEPGSFDAIVTSPAYGNRLADLYDGRDGTRRYTYRVALGRDLTAGNAGGVQWGPEYRRLHTDAWAEAARVLSWSGTVILNVSDHYRAGRRVPVVGWHLSAWARFGFVPVDVVPVATRRIRHGSAGSQARTDAELVAVLRRT